MDLGLETLSKVIIFDKYARYIEHLQRRETWEEIVNRYEGMMLKKYPQLKAQILANAQFIHDKKVLPSMRALQFAGVAAEVNNSRIYNCAFLPVDSIYAFSETMFLLLGGSGVGYSVQYQHISQLPRVYKPLKKRRYLIEDSIIGWAEAVRMLMKAYMKGGALPEFDFRAIRPKGAKLVTAGGKAPGPEPLKICLIHVQAVLDRKQDGEQLSALECHDILCHIANSVLAGGIRRSAMISLFSKEDQDMTSCKFGDWYELNEQRGRSNNSAILLRGETNKQDFCNLWEKIRLSGSGEPGIYWTNNVEWGTNPCAEIGLRPFQFCNLVEINADSIESQEDLNDRARAAAFFGTLQAGFTDFHYLRPIWRRTTEKDALVGIGMTGIASGKVFSYDLSQAAEQAKKTNQEVANTISINAAARLTCVKPSGTTSCVLGTSSGIHAWYARYYLRTVRFNKNQEVAKYLESFHPELCEDDILRPHDTLCVRFPVKAPEGAILRYESALETLERVKKFATEWIAPGHTSGDNSHNVSTTIFVKEDEWESVGEWMWNNRYTYNGMAVLPYDGGSYKQGVFEEITQEEYEYRVKSLHSIDLTRVIEEEDNQTFTQDAACSNGVCTIEA